MTENRQHQQKVPEGKDKFGERYRQPSQKKEIRLAHCRGKIRLSDMIPGTHQEIPASAKIDMTTGFPAISQEKVAVLVMVTHSSRGNRSSWKGSFFI
jgi:hypothetical protein